VNERWRGAFDARSCSIPSGRRFGGRRDATWNHQLVKAPHLSHHALQRVALLPQPRLRVLDQLPLLSLLALPGFPFPYYLCTRGLKSFRFDFDLSVGLLEVLGELVQFLLPPIEDACLGLRLLRVGSRCLRFRPQPL
jgi:hypothetical protein